MTFNSIEYKTKIIQNIAEKMNDVESTIAPIGSVPNNFKLYGNFDTPCLICHEEYYEIATIFNCGHMCCEICFSLYSSNNKSIECPTCRQVIKKIVYYIIERPKLDDMEFKILDKLSTKRIVKTEVNNISFCTKEIDTNLNPTVVVLNNKSTIKQHIAFLLDISGSMASSLSLLKNTLINFINKYDFIVSIDTFNNEHNIVNNPTTDKKILIDNINSITASGGTALGNALENFYNKSIKNWSIEPTLVIITDGATSDMIKSIEFFTKIKQQNNILLIGYGQLYNYDNCINIVNKDASLFEYAINCDALYDILEKNITIPITKVKIMTKDNNYIYTGSTRTQEFLLFVKGDNTIKITTTNGIPDIYINDTLIKPNLNVLLEPETSLFEFIITTLLNNIASNVFYTNALRMKLKLNSIEKYINNKLNDFVILNTLQTLITEIKDICAKELKKSENYGLNVAYLQRQTSNKIYRAVSQGIKSCYIYRKNTTT